MTLSSFLLEPLADLDVAGGSRPGVEPESLNA